MKLPSNSGTNSKRLVNIALFAGICEWYDFSLYTHMTAYIAPLFFPANDIITSILSAYIVFAVSYVGRVAGALFFGRMGDLNRPAALKLSLMTMAIPTILIGCLPTYATWGVFATIALSILRCIQGFGMGGEFPNSIAYVLDTAPKRYRTLLGSLTCASTSIGISLGALVVTGLHWIFDQAAISNYAWRIPFLLAIPLIGYIFWVRNTIVDTQPHTFRSPRLWNRLWEEKYNLLKVIVLGAMITTCGNLFLLWMPTYLRVFLNVSPYLASLSNTTTLWFEITTLVMMGYLTPFLSTEKTLKVLHTGLLILIGPIFYLLSTYPDSTFLLITMLLMCAFLLGSINGCFIEIIGDLLAYDVRSLGTSIVFAVSPAVFGGVAPLVATLLINKTGLLAAPAFIIFGIGLIALPVTFSLKTKSPL